MCLKQAIGLRPDDPDGQPSSEYTSESQFIKEHGMLSQVL
jgi:hypothetical protein